MLSVESCLAAVKVTGTASHCVVGSPCETVSYRLGGCHSYVRRMSIGGWWVTMTGVTCSAACHPEGKLRCVMLVAGQAALVIAHMSPTAAEGYCADIYTCFG